MDDASDVPARDVVTSDPRIKFFEMEENVGRYFIDAVASRANPYRYYMPHDSDDESVPERVEILKDRMDSCDDLDAVFNLEHRVGLDGTRTTMPLGSFHTPFSRERMTHRAHHSALYKNEVLLSTGGYHPGFRVSYDTFMVNVLKMTAKIDIVEAPLYIRYKMEDSLTVSPTTGLDSPYRAQVREQLMVLYRECLDCPSQAKTIIEGSIAQKTRARMISEIIRLKKEMNWF
jgi:hypothetical protein